MRTERSKRISDDVRWLRGQKIDLDDGSLIAFDSVAELLAFTAEGCRAEGHEEAEIVEVILLAQPQHQEVLVEAEAELAPLGYDAICAVLRRLAKKTKPAPPTFAQRLRLQSRAFKT